MNEYPYKILTEQGKHLLFAANLANQNGSQVGWQTTLDGTEIVPKDSCFGVGRGYILAQAEIIESLEDYPFALEEIQWPVIEQL